MTLGPQSKANAALAAAKIATNAPTPLSGAER